MSRREAHESLTVEAFERTMADVYSESVEEAVLDEAPMAYKPVESILEAIKPTAEVVDRLDVVHNLKATE
jgi:RNA-splicing ligase RtcB